MNRHRTKSHNKLLIQRISGIHISRLLQSLQQTLEELPVKSSDEFGRQFSGEPLQVPYYAVRVTGALFHTQGGLAVNPEGLVKHCDGETFKNLYAGGGAACGVSGSRDSGYLSGNGLLLSAAVLGYRAGQEPL